MGAITARVERFVAADGETRLPIHVFVPATPPRAALLLFHGGGWMRGSPGMLVPHARRLAESGILAASAGYRLVRSGADSPADCLEDAGRADTVFRALATEAGVERVAIGGGSAGAQMALSLAMPPGGAGAREYAGLVLFNPAVDQCCTRGPIGALMRHRLRLTPERARAASPAHHVRSGVPPSLVFHGTRDRLVAIDKVRRFRDAMENAGNNCELVEFQGAGHGFFLSRPRGNPAFDRTVELTERFLLTLATGPRLEAPTDGEKGLG